MWLEHNYTHVQCDFKMLNLRVKDNYVTGAIDNIIHWINLKKFLIVLEFVPLKPENMHTHLSPTCNLTWIGKTPNSPLRSEDQMIRMSTLSKNVLSLSRSESDIGWMSTYSNQSTIISSDMSSVGSPTDANTITMDTMPTFGMPAPPVLAAVTIKLNRRNSDGYVMLSLLV